jgi:membrane protein YqaA with SNARE-associated domain
MALLKPLGFWGLGGLSFVDAGLFPIPPTMDLIVIGYVATNPRRLVFYCFVAALGSALGSLIPYFVGRAGGELLLLKRVNRARYEKLRDRFEKQEFLAIAIPAMIPPPFPLKVVEFAAGVFEMKPLLFAAAIFCGKFLRFLLFAILMIVYGPKILHSFLHDLHQHTGLMLGLTGLILVGLVLFVVRRSLAKRGEKQSPTQDDEPTA